MTSSISFAAAVVYTLTQFDILTIALQCLDTAGTIVPQRTTDHQARCKQHPKQHAAGAPQPHRRQRDAPSCVRLHHRRHQAAACHTAPSMERVPHVLCGTPPLLPCPQTRQPQGTALSSKTPLASLNLGPNDFLVRWSFSFDTTTHQPCRRQCQAAPRRSQPRNPHPHRWTTAFSQATPPRAHNPPPLVPRSTPCCPATCPDQSHRPGSELAHARLRNLQPATTRLVQHRHAMPALDYGRRSWQK